MTNIMSGAAALAEQFRESRNWSAVAAEWAEYQYQGEAADFPTLYLDDLGMIPQLDDIAGIEFYQQRARLRAGDGDLVALTHPLEESYEVYNQRNLNLGRPSFLKVSNTGWHPIFIARNLMHDLPQLSRITQLARERGGLFIHPYLGAPDIWLLALRLHQLKAGAVKVIAPLPHLVDFINDKMEFTNTVCSIIGDKSVVETRVAHNEDEVISILKEISALYPAIAIKTRNYASAMGNLIFRSADLRKLPVGEFTALVKTGLWNLNWDGRNPLCIVRWYDDVLCSPSSHLWIPPRGKGLPVVEGIFEQLLEGETKVFAGSRPAVLPDRLKSEITYQTLRLGIFLQELGYVGRCSFDMIIHGPSLIEGQMKFVECNGRWGGTSLPMALYKRVFGAGHPFNYLARDYVDDRLKGRRFQDLLNIFKGRLFDVNTGQGDYILYNVGCLDAFGKFDVMVLGDSEEELKYRSFQEIALLIDLDFGKFKPHCII